MKNIILKPGANTITLDNFESVNGCRINAIEVLCSTDCTVTFTLNCEGFAAAHQLASVSVSSGRGFTTLSDTYLSLGDIITVSGAPSSAYIHCFTFASREDTSSPPAPTDSFLTFTAEQAGSKVCLWWGSGSNVMYRQNKGEWKDYTQDEWIILENIGDSVQLKGRNVCADANGMFGMRGLIAASGSVTSLIDEVGDDPNVTLPDWCFWKMFDYQTPLTKAPSLPAKTLSEECYAYMFNGCTNLKEAPVLPATTLASLCYRSMFMGCSNLTTPPDLPATTLADYCYCEMFSDCTSLTYSPTLPAKIMVEGCYCSMFYNTALVTSPTLSSIELANSCYATMFMGCDKLTAPPNLPALTLAEECYAYMFCGCDNLTYAPILKASSLAVKCYLGMFYSCPKLKFSANGGIGNVVLDIPTGTTQPSYWNLNMLKDTGGTFTGDPQVGVKYYNYQ